MSQEARQALVDNPRVHFDLNQAPHTKDDLLDPQQTDTYLIALCDDLLERTSRPLLLLFARRDHHPDYDLGPHGHWGSQTGPGFSLDLWNADYSDPQIGDAGIEDVIDAALASPYCWTLGLAGYASQFYQHAMQKSGKGQIVFLDTGGDHCHVQVANDNGSGKRF